MLTYIKYAYWHCQHIVNPSQITHRQIYHNIIIGGVVLANSHISSNFFRKCSSIGNSSLIIFTIIPSFLSDVFCKHKKTNPYHELVIYQTQTIKIRAEFLLVAKEGIEPPTFRVWTERSSQLSYFAISTCILIITK